MLQFASSAARTRGARLAVCLMTPAAALLLSIAYAGPQAEAQAVTDKISYDVGETVRVRIATAAPDEAVTQSNRLLTIRYAGEATPVVERVPFKSSDRAAGADGYREVWKVPDNTRTGRYEIDMEGLDPKTHQVTVRMKSVATFAVHRKLVRIERIELDKTFYTSGDSVSCQAVLRNLTGRSLTGLRVEFSERYWPWIAQQVRGVGSDVFTIVKSLDLKPGIETEVRWSRAATVKPVQQPTVKQYAVVVWDEARKNVFDIAFSPLTFVQPINGSGRKVYPGQYISPDLAAVETSNYRQFIHPEFGSTAIQFDSGHTMYEPGDEALVKFTIVNSTDRPWRGVKIQAGLRALGSAEFAKQVVAEGLDLEPRKTRLEQGVKFRLPSENPGTYRVVVEVISKSDEVLAAGQLELAANPLPDSILLFCAHEDDDGAHMGIIRAAIENHIPIHVVYFTSGDAGSCDRYYEHSCRPAEALNFGGVRMDEARAALGHLGVPRENIHFLGLPDGGSGEIWYRHLDSSDPYLSVLLASDHAPYESLERPNLPYARQPVVEAARELIKKFQPQVVITAHPPAEGHIDHVVNNFFVVRALQEMSRQGPLPPGFELWVDRIYDPKGHPSAPYRYEERPFAITGEVAARAQEAGWFYQSQGGNRSKGNVRDFGQLPRMQSYRVVLDWKEHEGWNDKE